MRSDRPNRAGPPHGPLVRRPLGPHLTLVRSSQAPRPVVAWSWAEVVRLEARLGGRVAAGRVGTGVAEAGSRWRRFPAGWSPAVRRPPSSVPSGPDELRLRHHRSLRIALAGVARPRRCGDGAGSSRLSKLASVIPPGSDIRHVPLGAEANGPRLPREPGTVRGNVSRPVRVRGAAPRPCPACGQWRACPGCGWSR